MAFKKMKRGSRGCRNKRVCYDTWSLWLSCTVSVDTQTILGFLFCLFVLFHIMSLKQSYYLVIVSKSYAILTPIFILSYTAELIEISVRHMH